MARPTFDSIFVAVAVATALPACSHAVGAPGAQGPGEGDAANDDAGPVTTVLVGPNADHSYLPRAVTIPVGTTVEWLWESDGHNVTSGAEGMADGLFCSPSDASCASPPTSNTGTIYRHKFTSPGTFPYFCGPHYSVGMKATITVQ